ncbi:MAG TPA: hypothetical protein VGR62_26375 [Candidatus Binatia bacterium]|jgi:hypothetical protein|nr:hypothetical protein [Candidatus Binatia bacterium]
MPSERARLIALLDQMQAADGAGAAALAQWVASCADPRLRGGLRVLQSRDACHARLAADRLAALGVAAEAAPSRNLTALLHVLAAPGVGDRSKLAILIARFPLQPDDPFVPLVGAIADDDETRALLETIADDDRVSLRWLRELGSAPPVIAGALDPDDRAEVASCLDALLAAEAASAAVLDAWAARCGLPGLRGGLHTLAAREATHARLCAERLAALGMEPRARLSARHQEAAVTYFGHGAVVDEDKLATVLARYPTDDDAGAPVLAMADRLAADPETRELLRVVAAAEVVTVAWLRSYHAALVAGPTLAGDRPANG